jgi:dihydrofolate synthase/folylpolyglutamate synthase
VITPISIDHTQYLGETIEEIAAEKAGILKRGVYCVVGPQEDAALEVIEAKAAEVGAALLIHGQQWQVWEENGRLVYQDENGLLDLPLPNLIGAHQVQNAGAAIAALRALGKNEAACEAAITTAQWPARLQRLRQGPLVQAAGQAELWLDGGHNPAAGQALVEALQRLPSRPTYLICGMLNTKDITGYLAPLAEVSEGLFGVSIEGEAATLEASETVAAARSIGIESDEAQSVADAISMITSKDPAARILICGSLYLAGRVLQENS